VRQRLSDRFTNHLGRVAVIARELSTQSGARICAVQREARGALESGTSLGDDANVAVAMDFAELDHFEFDRGRTGFRIAQHILARGSGVHAVGLDRQVVIVAENKRH